MATRLLQVKVLSPKDTLYDGPALAVSSKNTSGKFDMLPEHANFVTFIENDPITITTPENKKLTFKFPMGIIYITKDNVTIYTQPQALKI